jgi:HK97 family phage major capsid protein
MSIDVSASHVRKSKLIAEAQEMLNAGKAQTAEYRAKVEEIDTMQMLIDATVRAGLDKAPVTEPAPAVIKTESSEERKAKLNVAFRSMMLHGYNGTRPEQRDITIATDGTAVIPQEFSKVITEAQKWYGPIATLVKVINSDTGRSYKQTISDDTASTMTYVAETGATSGFEADPTLRSTIPGTDSLVTMVKYSRQELEDADDLEAFIRGIAGLRVARATEYALTLGLDNGSNTALPNSPTGGLLGNVPTGTTTASLAAGIGYDDLTALATSVDHAYWAAPGSGFMASPATFQYLLSQKDAMSRPYYLVDPVTGLLQIAGKPLYINNAMPSYATASTKAVLFGDFSRAYSYLNGAGVGGMRIRILSERYADVFEGAAIIYTRLGAATLVSGAVKALVTAAS